MKALLFLLICAVGGYYGYQYFTDGPSGTASPRLAPPNIYFTKERFSEKTEFGVRALRAGTRVTLVRKEGQTWVVLNDAKHEFRVPAHILTNNLDERDALLTTIADEQDKVRHKAEADVLIAQQQSRARVKRFHDEIERLRLRLDELRLQRGRVEEQLQLEIRNSKEFGLSGNPMMGERETRESLSRIESDIKIAERKIENLQLSIRKESLGD